MYRKFMDELSDSGRRAALYLAAGAGLYLYLYWVLSALTRSHHGVVGDHEDQQKTGVDDEGDRHEQDDQRPSTAT